MVNHKRNGQREMSIFLLFIFGNVVHALCHDQVAAMKATASGPVGQHTPAAGGRLFSTIEVSTRIEDRLGSLPAGQEKFIA